MNIDEYNDLSDLMTNDEVEAIKQMMPMLPVHRATPINDYSYVICLLGQLSTKGIKHIKSRHKLKFQRWYKTMCIHPTRGIQMQMMMDGFMKKYAKIRVQA